MQNLVAQGVSLTAKTIDKDNEEEDFHMDDLSSTLRSTASVVGEARGDGDDIDLWTSGDETHLELDSDEEDRTNPVCCVLGDCTYASDEDELDCIDPWGEEGYR